MAKMNKAIDELRAAEAKRLDRDGYVPVLKHFRWCLLKREEHLTEKQAVKLISRSVRLAHREAEGSMIATQLLLCQGALARPATSFKEELPVMCSPRKVLLEIRRDINGRSPKGESFAERIAKAQRERRTRQTPKEKRQWPRRKTHEPPKPPIILRMTSELKAEVEQNLQAA